MASAVLLGEDLACLIHPSIGLGWAYFSVGVTIFSPLTSKWICCPMPNHRPPCLRNAPETRVVRRVKTSRPRPSYAGGVCESKGQRIIHILHYRYNRERNRRGIQYLESLGDDVDHCDFSKRFSSSLAAMSSLRLDAQCCSSTDRDRTMSPSF